MEVLDVGAHLLQQLAEALGMPRIAPARAAHGPGAAVREQTEQDAERARREPARAVERDLERLDVPAARWEVQARLQLLVERELPADHAVQPVRRIDDAEDDVLSVV